jgi:hypothetical protein
LHRSRLRIAPFSASFAQIEQCAYSRGEWLSSLSTNGVDLVERLVKGLLIDHHRCVDATIQSLGTMGMFCNADRADLTSMVRWLYGSTTS